MIQFSNPRIHAEIENYPLGGNRRGTCIFNLESHPKKGFRFTRITTGKAKLKTYGGPGAIVDGSDGRTYLIQSAGGYGFISICSSDFMSADPGVVGKNPVWPFDGDRYQELAALIEQANSTKV